MTSDELFEIAQAVGFNREEHGSIYGMLERFGKAVAIESIRESSAEYLLGWNDGQVVEREEIAKMFENAPALVPHVTNDLGGCMVCGFTPRMAVAAIRARGQE